MNAIYRYLSAMIIPLLLASCVSSKKLPSAALKLDRQGHRGARGLMPENTIPSMYIAIDLGVTTVEVDVVVSKDSQVVVSHEGYFHELITTTPEGETLSREDAVTRLLFQMNYDSIRRYDVGLKPHPEFPRQKKIAAYKPTLAELIDSTDAYARKKGRSIRYNIEMKSDPQHDGLRHPPVVKFTDMVVDVIRQKGIANRC